MKLKDFLFLQSHFFEKKFVLLYLFLPGYSIPNKKIYNLNSKFYHIIFQFQTYPYGLLKAMVQTTLACSLRSSNSSPDKVSQILQVLSYEPVMNLSPSLLKAQLVNGRRCALRVLKSLNLWFSFICCLWIRLSITYFSCGLRDSEIRGSSRRIQSISLSTSVLFQTKEFLANQVMDRWSVL